MKRIIKYASLVMILVVAVSCSSTKSIGVSGDGTSFETAIIAKSISFEYDWIAKEYPGSKVEMQMLSFNKKKPYDIISIVTVSGEEKDIYFDVSRFYGKF